MKKFIPLIIVIIVIGVLTYYLLPDYLDNQKYKAENKKYEKIKEEINVKSSDKEELSFSYNFDSLKTLNDDAWGYIYIKDTKVDYPIAKTKDNDYYLNHNFNKESSIYGSIYVDYRCNDDSLNLILYGHHMNNGSMFGDIVKYRDSNYMEKHSTIYIAIKDSVYEYKPVAFVEVSPTDQEAFKCSFTSLKEHQAWVKKLQDKAITKSKYTNNNTISLCTCTNTNENRYILVIEQK